MGGTSVVGFLGVLLLAVIIGAIVVSLVAGIVRWRDRVKQPCCGLCRYPVEGLTVFTCPECGSDLREAGILVPGVRPKHRIHVAELLAAWAASVVVLGLISTTAMMGLPYGRAVHFSRGSTLMPGSGTIAPISVDAHGVATGGMAVSVAPARRLVLQNLQVGTPMPARLEVLYSNATWSIIPGGGATPTQQTVRGRLPMTEAQVTAWLAAAGYSRVASAPAEEIAALTAYINSGGTSADPVLNIAMRGAGMITSPAGWVLWGNLAAWMVIFALGSWLIVRANRSRGARRVRDAVRGPADHGN